MDESSSYERRRDYPDMRLKLESLLTQMVEIRSDMKATNLRREEMHRENLEWRKSQDEKVLRHHLALYGNGKLGIVAVVHGLTWLLGALIVSSVAYAVPHFWAWIAHLG